VAVQIEDTAEHIQVIIHIRIAGKLVGYTTTSIDSQKIKDISTCTCGIIIDIIWSSRGTVKGNRSAGAGIKSGW